MGRSGRSSVSLSLSLGVVFRKEVCGNRQAATYRRAPESESEREGKRQRGDPRACSSPIHLVEQHRRLVQCCEEGASSTSVATSVRACPGARRSLGIRRGGGGGGGDRGHRQVALQSLPQLHLQPSILEAHKGRPGACASRMSASRDVVAATMRVAIVGAGSAGMAMAKQLMDVSGGTVPFVVYDRRSEVGGIWQYDADVPEGVLAWEDEQAQLHAVPGKSGGTQRGTCLQAQGGPASSSSEGASHAPLQRTRLRFAWQGERQPGPMFDGLRTNIPSDLMTYRDTPFTTSDSLFPSRSTVQQYLESYATQHDLRRHVRFGTAITSIRKSGLVGPWIVSSRPGGIQNAKERRAQVNDQADTEEEFTHLVLAHGRCNTPNIPNIPGLETYNGRVTHSQWYRDPTKLLRPGEAQRVLIVGNASSGMDIARELSGYITRTLPCGIAPEEWRHRCSERPFDVLQSWHSPDKAPPLDYNPLDTASPDWCRRIKVVASIERVDGPQIHLSDGSTLNDVPLILFGTGFLFDNEFLDQSSGPLQTHPLLPPSSSTTRQGFPSPSMYNMDDWFLLHSRDESLAMLGLPVTVVPFPLTEVQACYVAHRWLGKAAKLPRVDPRFAQNDAQRWTSRARDVKARTNGAETNHNAGQGKAAGGDIVLHTLPHVFGTPSDIAYTDALLRMVQDAEPEAGTRAPWASAYEQTSDGKGGGAPRGPEALYETALWRVERRGNGRVLRRATLGY